MKRKPGLIKENLFSDGSVRLVEAETTDGKVVHRVEGIGGKADIINRNGRRYRESVYASAIGKAQEWIQKGKFIGQVDHPGFFDDGADLKNAAVLWERVWLEDKLMKLEGRILNTPSGQLLYQLLQDGVGVGLSTRGYGSMKEEELPDGTKFLDVQDDYELVGVDFVLMESNPYGQVTHYENLQRGAAALETVQELRDAYPQLVEQIEAEARAKAASELEEQAKANLTESIRKEVEAEFNARVDAEVNARFEAKKAEFEKAVLESEAVTQYKNAVQGIVEALSRFVPEVKQALESELQAKVKELEEALQTKEAALNELAAKVAKLETEKAEAQKAQELQQYLLQKTEGHKYQDLLRQRLADCKSKEEIDQKFDAEVAFLEKIQAGATQVPEGKGQVADKPEDDNLKVEDSDYIREQRRLAGLPVD